MIAQTAAETRDMLDRLRSKNVPRFEWDQVQPGDVLAWLPGGGAQTRRVLVEEVGEALPSGARFVWGVEVTSRYQIRGRRRLRDWLRRRPFWIHAEEVQIVGRGDERIAALQARLAELRGVL